MSDPIDSINVICRFRPRLPQESDSDVCFQYIDTTAVTISSKENHTFTFDRVFDPATSQSDVYDYSISHILDDFLQGYNGTVLAYGQTGSGKSYTMMGPSIYDSNTKGIIPRISQHLFDRISTAGPEIEYSISINYFEIYMEQIQDLLNPLSNPETPHERSSTPTSPSTPKQSRFSINQDKENGIHIKGLTEIRVTSSQELLQVLQRGLKNRTSSPTLMNQESSRSHAIFQVKLSQKHIETEIIKNSHLFLVDLAGSEKIDKTGVMGQTLEEAKKINKSLSALGNVINTLSENKSSHVPYRDSKLTRVLQESLGGNSRTSLIINCSPSSLNSAETLSTLRFGTRAKKIQNAPHINTELSTSALKKKVKHLEALNEQNQSYIMELEQEVYRLRAAEPQSPTPVVSESPTSLKRDHFAGSMMPISTQLSNLHSHNDEIERRDNRIAELEDQILSMKLENMRNTHSEDSKLFVLENSLCKLNDKLTEVEMININLRKHLLMSEKIIESRDAKVNKLKATLKEQQELISKQTMGFKYKLSDIQSKLEFYNQQKHLQNDIMNRQSSISSEKDESLKHESYPEIVKPAHTTA